MLRFYARYTYFNSVSAGIDFIRQILTYKVAPRAGRVKALHNQILILQPLEVVSRCRDPQLELGAFRMIYGQII